MDAHFLRLCPHPYSQNQTGIRDTLFLAFPPRVTVSFAGQLMRRNTVAECTEHQLLLNPKIPALCPFSNIQIPISVLSVAKARRYDCSQRTLTRLPCITNQPPLYSPLSSRVRNLLSSSRATMLSREPFRSPIGLVRQKHFAHQPPTQKRSAADCIRAGDYHPGQASCREQFLDAFDEGAHRAEIQAVWHGDRS